MRKLLPILASLALAVCLISCAPVTMNTRGFMAQQDMLGNAEIRFVQAIPGDSFGKYIPRFAAIGVKHHLTVAIVPFSKYGLFDLWGFYDPQAQLIAINAELTPDEEVMALAHELGHALGPQDLPNPDTDIVAQAIAGIVMDRIGLKAGAYATAAYFRGIPEEYRNKVLSRYAKQIDATVTEMLGEL